jgi:dimethylsulfone monooxygenase
MVAGWGGIPLVGTPEMIVDNLVALNNAGVNGIGLGWVDYQAGVEQFNEQILPLMVSAGLRQA